MFIKMNATTFIIWIIAFSLCWAKSVTVVFLGAPLYVPTVELSAKKEKRKDVDDVP